jgi:O-methyltransferase domain
VLEQLVGRDVERGSEHIHDWEDEDAMRILQVVRRAIPDDGAVLLIEADLGPPNDTPAAKFADLNRGLARRARAHAR